MPYTTNLLAGWWSFLGGVLSGALVGLFFHEDRFLGGYGSFRRRLVRLGHISFFGIGLLNVLFAFSGPALHLPAEQAMVGSRAWVAAAIAMPLCCFLTAWRPPFRHLFPVPVVAAGAGIVAVLL